MPKVTTVRRNAEPASNKHPSKPTATRFTSGQALLSAYSPKPGAVGIGKKSLPGVSVKATAKDPLPRVWNFNKPKILKNFNVYGMEPPTVKAGKTTVRRWVNPPYPVERRKTKTQSGGPRNYDALYVPLDEDGDSSKANISQIGQSKVSKAVEAKRRQVYINHWSQLEANQEVLKEKQPPFKKFPCLLKAGERHSLKVQTKNGEMAKLIGEVMEIRQQLGIANALPVPISPKSAGEFQPPPLVRSRTRTYFSISDCPHPKLHEYIRRLPHAPTPITPITTQEGGSGASEEH